MESTTAFSCTGQARRAEMAHGVSIELHEIVLLLCKREWRLRDNAFITTTTTFLSGCVVTNHSILIDGEGRISFWPVSSFPLWPLKAFLGFPSKFMSSFSSAFHLSLSLFCSRTNELVMYGISLLRPKVSFMRHAINSETFFFPLLKLILRFPLYDLNVLTATTQSFFLYSQEGV